MSSCAGYVVALVLSLRARALGCFTKPPRSITPTPTLGGLSSPKVLIDDVKTTNVDTSQEVVKLRAQVENLTLKAQLQEIELERTSKQLKEAMAVAKEESSKFIAAEEVVKSLTSQLKEMAERLPVGAARNIKSPSLTSNISSADISSNAQVDSVDQSHGQTMAYEEPDSNDSKSPLKPNAINNRNSTQNKPVQSAAARNSSRSNNGESQNGVDEWVEQDEPGVYITLTSLPGGIKDLKRVRFSRKRFSEKQAEQWWTENRTRAYEKYNVLSA